MPLICISEEANNMSFREILIRLQGLPQGCWCKQQSSWYSRSIWHTSCIQLTRLTSRSCCGCSRLTHWGRHKMAAIVQPTLSNPFLCITIVAFRLLISLKFVLNGPISNTPSLVKIRASLCSYLNQWSPSVQANIYASPSFDELLETSLNLMLWVWDPTCRHTAI